MGQGWRYMGGLQLMDKHRPHKETISDNYKITLEFCEHGKSPYNLVKTFYKDMLAKPLRVIIRNMCKIWALFQYVDHLSMYKDIHYKDKMIVKPYGMIKINIVSNETKTNHHI